MKKIALVLGVVTLLMGFYSCTPQSMETQAPFACCGDDDPLPPPPPPPPPGGGNG